MVDFEIVVIDLVTGHLTHSNSFALKIEFQIVVMTMVIRKPAFNRLIGYFNWQMVLQDVEISPPLAIRRAFLTAEPIAIRQEIEFS